MGIKIQITRCKACRYVKRAKKDIRYNRCPRCYSSRMEILEEMEI